jgi:hypothetical protein
VGGSKAFRQSIIASAAVTSVDNVGHRVPRIDQESALSNAPHKILRLKQIRYLSPPIPIRPLIGKLSFLPNYSKTWGASLMGGCRRISNEDFELLSQAIFQSRLIAAMGLPATGGATR